MQVARCAATGRQPTAGLQVQAGCDLLVDSQRATSTEPETAISPKRHSCSDSNRLSSKGGGFASRDPKAELTRALRNSSGHHIQARHHLIVIAEQQLKGLEDRALDALGQVFVAEDPGVRLAQPPADRHAGHEGPVRAAPAQRRTLTTASYIRRIHLHFGYVAPKTVICALSTTKRLR